MEILMLLRTLDLLDAESLPSFLARLSQVNFYESVSLLITLCAECAGIPAKKILTPVDVAAYDVLSKVTGVSPLNIYGATHHRFARVVTPPGTTLQTLT